MFGYIEIPKIDCRISLYLGSSDQHMGFGAAVLGGTSLPVGGQNTNCVIAGHRGWKHRAYFKRIEELEPGDEVLVTNPWQCLHYRVAYTEIILPTDSEKLEIQDGNDMITLLTCHRYRSGGKYRYIVYCFRSDGEQKLSSELPEQGNEQNLLRREEMQTAKDGGEDLTSVADIDRESVFRRAEKMLVFILVIVLLYVEGGGLFFRKCRYRTEQEHMERKGEDILHSKRRIKRDKRIVFQPEAYGRTVKVRWGYLMLFTAGGGSIFGNAQNCNPSICRLLRRRTITCQLNWFREINEKANMNDGDKTGSMSDRVLPKISDGSWGYVVNGKVQETASVNAAKSCRLVACKERLGGLVEWNFGDCDGWHKYVSGKQEVTAMRQWKATGDGFS